MASDLKSRHLSLFQVIDGFTGKIYSQIQIFNQLGSSVLLLFVVPFLTNKLLWHEATLGTLVNFLCLVAYVVKIFARKVFPDVSLNQPAS